jgi:hypothetical protein
MLTVDHVRELLRLEALETTRDARRHKQPHELRLRLVLQLRQACRVEANVV